MHIGSDGGGNFSGKHNGFNALFKKMVPFGETQWCVNHREALCMKDVSMLVRHAATQMCLVTCKVVPFPCVCAVSVLAGLFAWVIHVPADTTLRALLVGCDGCQIP